MGPSSTSSTLPVEPSAKVDAHGAFASLLVEPIQNSLVLDDLLTQAPAVGDLEVHGHDCRILVGFRDSARGQRRPTVNPRSPRWYRDLD